jgi:hypothetical protein
MARTGASSRGGGLYYPAKFDAYVNPYLNVRYLDQNGLDKLLDGYNEYAEFLIGIELVETSSERALNG